MHVVAEITDLWVENSQKINCRDVTSTWGGKSNYVTYLSAILLNRWKNSEDE